MRTSIEDADGPVRPVALSSTRCSAHAPIWHEGWKAVTTHPTIAGWGHFNDDEWEPLPRRPRPVGGRQPRREGAGEAARAGQHLVLRGRRERGVPARRPVRGGDHDRRHGRSSPPRRTATLTTWARLPCRVAGHAHPRPLLRDRRTRRHPRRGRRAVRAWVPASAATPSTSATTGSLRVQLRRQRGSSRSSATEDIPTGMEPDPFRLVRVRRVSSPTRRPGMLSLFHGDKKVGQGRIKTQLGPSPSPARAPTRGPARAEPVTDDYPGEPPYAFIGGAPPSHPVSGEAYSPLSARLP